MSFLYPSFFLLVLPLIVVFLLFPPEGARQWFWRVGLSVLLLLALARVQIEGPLRPGQLVVVADRSASMPDGAEKHQLEMIQLLENSRPLNAPGLAIVTFAASAAAEKLSNHPWEKQFLQRHQPDRSDLNTALDTALQLIPGELAGRILLLTDGRWTDRNPREKFTEGAARGIPVDYRRLQRSSGNDFAITHIDHPRDSAPGEAIALQLELSAPQAARGELILFRQGKLWRQGRVELRPGSNRYRFQDQSAEPGILHYQAVLKMEETDACPENNRADFLVRVTGRRPILLFTRKTDSGLEKLLRDAHVPVDRRLPGEIEFTLDRLAGYAAVILENIPASHLGKTGQANLAALVESGSLGLLVTGGKSSFGLGGYYQSPLEKVLPVTMELRNDHRKGTVALAITLDRSGSMAASVGGHRMKMDLANLGTAEAIRMLGPRDEVAVFAVDSSSHRILSMMPADQAKKRLDEVLSIASMGGGIFVYNALEAASAELLKSKASTRHIILFADAADSEQPGKYRELLAQCAQSGITVSVIGLGTEKDSDAQLLIDIARRGGGEIYFSNDPDMLPQVFMQDTITIARTTFQEEPTKVKLNAASRILRGTGFAPAEFEIGGYNLCYLKPGATAPAVTADGNDAPVIAFTEAGNGRSGVFTGEVTGEYSGKFNTYTERGDLLLSLLQYLAHPDNDLPGDSLVEQSLVNGLHRITLHLNPDRESDPFRRTPEIIVLEPDATGLPRPVRYTMNYINPDTLRLELPLRGAAPSVSFIEFDRKKSHPLTPMRLPYSPEFFPEEADSRENLHDLAALSGGHERLELSGIWEDLKQQPRRYDPVLWLLSAAILWLLLMVADRRMDLFAWRFPRLKNTGTVRTKTPRARRTQTPEPETPPAPPEETPPEEESNVLEAMKSMKKWRK